MAVRFDGLSGCGVVLEWEGCEVVFFFWAELEGAPDGEGEDGRGEEEGDYRQGGVPVFEDEAFEHWDGGIRIGGKEPLMDANFGMRDAPPYLFSLR